MCESTDDAAFSRASLTATISAADLPELSISCNKLAKSGSESENDMLPSFGAEIRGPALPSGDSSVGTDTRIVSGDWGAGDERPLSSAGAALIVASELSAETLVARVGEVTVEGDDDRDGWSLDDARNGDGARGSAANVAAAPSTLKTMPGLIDLLFDALVVGTPRPAPPPPDGLRPGVLVGERGPIGEGLRCGVASEPLRFGAEGEDWTDVPPGVPTLVTAYGLAGLSGITGLAVAERETSLSLDQSLDETCVVSRDGGAP